MDHEILQILMLTSKHDFLVYAPTHGMRLGGRIFSKISSGEANRLRFCFHTERIKDEMTNKMPKCYLLTPNSATRQDRNARSRLHRLFLRKWNIWNLL
jgi:hypothetical protein